MDKFWSLIIKNYYQYIILSNPTNVFHLSELLMTAHRWCIPVFSSILSSRKMLISKVNCSSQNIYCSISIVVWYFFLIRCIFKASPSSTQQVAFCSQIAKFLANTSSDMFILQLGTFLIINMQQWLQCFRYRSSLNVNYKFTLIPLVFK